MRNSYGNTKRDVMKFCREVGVKPTAANVERMQREVSRSQTENERVVERHKAIGGPSLVDHRGDVHGRVKKMVRRDLGLEK